ncbi:MAG: phytase [Anaerolineales bacterium]|nr:phytase [Anaerolineales bacterium]
MTKRLSLILSLILVTIFLVAFQTEPDEAPVAEVEPAAETEPTPNDGATLAVVWVHPTDPAQSALIAADDNGGLAVYDLSGKQLQYLDDSAISNVDLRYNFALGDESITLVAAGVKDEPMINLYQINPDTRELTSLGQIETGIPLAGLCMYRSLISGLDYVFANSEDGEVEQWELAADDSGQIQAKLARDFEVGSETEACVADDELAQLYISEGDTGVWKYGAEPEDGTIRRIVDTYRGNISAEVEGLALYYADDGEGYLIASNQSDDNFLVYQRGDDNEFVGTFAVVDGAGADGVSEAGGLSVTNLPLGEAFPAGVFVAADDENTDPDASTNFKLVSWADIAQAMDPPLVVDPASWDQRVVGAGGDLQSEVAQAAASVETEAVKSSTDAADDPAIWIHPTDPTQSTIIGTNKQGGLAVYDLEGQQIQFVEIGRVNNVDLRYNFPLGGEAVALVIASNRNDDSLAIYKVNPDTHKLEDVAAGTISAEVSNDVYGTCLYVSPATGKYYVIVNSTNTGQVAQFELADNGQGQVGAKLVRSFKVGSQTEGCVADDETGQLYIGEEEAGIWKYGLNRKMARRAPR